MLHTNTRNISVSVCVLPSHRRLRPTVQYRNIFTVEDLIMPQNTDAEHFNVKVGTVFSNKGSYLMLLADIIQLLYINNAF